jgi:hypothetical protein
VAHLANICGLRVAFFATRLCTPEWIRVGVNALVQNVRRFAPPSVQTVRLTRSCGAEHPEESSGAECILPLWKITYLASLTRACECVKLYRESSGTNRVVCAPPRICEGAQMTRNPSRDVDRIEASEHLVKEGCFGFVFLTFGRWHAGAPPSDGVFGAPFPHLFPFLRQATRAVARKRIC